MRTCECGCEKPTKQYTQTSIKHGRVKGQYARYLLGHNAQGRTKGSVPWNKGMTGAEIWGSIENHPRWISDRTLLKTSEEKKYDCRYKSWMLAVKRRDNWKCRINNQDCKGRLEAHHILAWREFIELRYDINNGITLCHAHHPRSWAEEKRLQAEFQALVSAPKEIL